MESAQRLSEQFHPSIPILPPERLIGRCDLVMEAASAQAVGELLPLVIRQRKAMLILSAGGLLQYPELLRRARAREIPLYLPSGALAGLDGIKAGAFGKLRQVILTTRKPPRAFAGAPEILRRKIRLSGLRAPKVIFEGPAAQAVRAFPQNINVAATLSLAGIGPQRTRVRIVADPGLKINIHEVEAVGDFGRLQVRAENRPASGNPKTSRLAVLSALATLEQILRSGRIGT